MTAFLDEAQVEMSLVETLRELGYAYVHGPDIAHAGDRPERSSYADVVLDEGLEAAPRRNHTSIPSEAHDAAPRPRSHSWNTDVSASPASR